MTTLYFKSDCYLIDVIWYIYLLYSLLTISLGEEGQGLEELLSYIGLV